MPSCRSPSARAHSDALKRCRVRWHSRPSRSRLRASTADRPSGRYEPPPRVTPVTSAVAAGVGAHEHVRGRERAIRRHLRAHAARGEARLGEHATSRADVRAERELSAERPLASLAGRGRCGERSEAERAIARDADVRRERARAERVARVVEPTEPADRVVAALGRNAGAGQGESRAGSRARSVAPPNRARRRRGAARRHPRSSSVDGSLALRATSSATLYVSALRISSPSAPTLPRKPPLRAPSERPAASVNWSGGGSNVRKALRR